MSLIGYIRVSSADQNEQRQVEILKPHGCQKIFIDKASGKDMLRPEFENMNKYIREGDSLIVASIDRLGRNVIDILKYIETLKERGVKLIICDFMGASLDSTSEQGLFLITIFSALAKYERSLILERQRQGIAIAKARGVYKGRRPILSDDDVMKIKELLKIGVSKTHAARQFGITRQCLDKSLKRSNNDK